MQVRRREIKRLKGKEKKRKEGDRKERKETQRKWGRKMKLNERKRQVNEIERVYMYIAGDSGLGDLHAC